MHIAYNALNPEPNMQITGNAEMQLRIAAYTRTCEKYRKEIAAIQKYLPGWAPAFHAKG